MELFASYIAILTWGDDSTVNVWIFGYFTAISQFYSVAIKKYSRLTFFITNG